MGDLISRSALIEELHHMIEWDVELKQDYEYLGIDDCIRSMPTAYDIEKVVAELEERRSKFDCKYCKHFFNGKKECDRDCADALIDDLFEIVRRGGVNG